jgi:hypothetical protein
VIRIQSVNSNNPALNIQGAIFEESERSNNLDSINIQIHNQMEINGMGEMEESRNEQYGISALYDAGGGPVSTSGGIGGVN